MQKRRPRCAQHGDGAVDIRVLLALRTRLPGNTPSTGCVQKKVFACEAIHNGRKLSTLGISRTTLHVQLTTPGWRSAERSRGSCVSPPPGADGLRGRPGLRGAALGEPVGERRDPPAGAAGRAPSGPSGAPRAAGPSGPLEPAWAADPAANEMRAFAGRALARLSNIRACVR